MDDAIMMINIDHYHHSDKIKDCGRSHDSWKEGKKKDVKQSVDLRYALVNSPTGCFSIIESWRR